MTLLDNSYPEMRASSLLYRLKILGQGIVMYLVTYLLIRAIGYGRPHNTIDTMTSFRGH